MVDLLRNRYLDISSSVILVSEEGNWFLIRTGLIQGRVISLSLFNVYMNAKMRKVTGQAGG